MAEEIPNATPCCHSLMNLLGWFPAPSFDQFFREFDSGSSYLARGRWVGVDGWVSMDARFQKLPLPVLLS